MICSTKAHSRVIDSIPVRPCLIARRRAKSGKPALNRGESSGSDALCFTDHPASGGAPFCAVGSRASSGLEPCESGSRGTAGRLPGFRLVEPTARRVARPSPRSRDGVSRIMRARAPSWQGASATLVQKMFVVLLWYGRRVTTLGQEGNGNEKTGRNAVVLGTPDRGEPRSGFDSGRGKG